MMRLVEQAFDYRGHVTIERYDGSKLVGFIYDRGASHIEMFDEHATRRIVVALDDIANITLSGEDIAAKSQRGWERRRDRLESRDTSAWGDWEERPTLILVALPIELRGIAPALGSTVHGTSATGRVGGTRVVARAVGVGGGAAHVVAEEHPRFVISCGFAGALDGALAPGDLVLASSVRDESGDTVIARESVLDVARRTLTNKRVAEGELLCATRIAAKRDDKHALARPGRLAVDLESWAAARAAERARIPWLAIRVILDPLDIDLPTFAGEVRSDYGVSVLRHALRGPSAIVELARLSVRTAVALGSLRQAMQELVPVLGRVEAGEVRT
ncbi:MAG: hypothetical protein HOV81_20285 [Kofleriaceae bacterium]|nr:hypothetical protein [Kofleriaceae bacterium]